MVDINCRIIKEEGTQYMKLSVDFDEGMRQRAKEVVGATNQCIMLRNCEHVVMYIYSGIWLSKQT